MIGNFSSYSPNFTVLTSQTGVSQVFLTSATHYCTFSNLISLLLYMDVQIPPPPPPPPPKTTKKKKKKKKKK